MAQFKNSMQFLVSRMSAYNAAAKFLILFNNPDYQHNATNNDESLAELFLRLMYDKFDAANVVFCCANGILTYNVFISDPYANSENCGTSNCHKSKNFT